MDSAGADRHARQDNLDSLAWKTGRLAVGVLDHAQPGAALDYLGNSRLTRRGCGSLARRSLVRMAPWDMVVLKSPRQAYTGRRN
jgi:hypothetical protein